MIAPSLLKCLLQSKPKISLPECLFIPKSGPEASLCKFECILIFNFTTTVNFLPFSCFVFARELLEDHIHCIQDGSDATGGTIQERAFNSYCYISETFTLPNFAQKSTDNFPHPGIGPVGSQHNSEELKYHNYYMWIPYLLLFQSTTFFIPLLLHRFFQKGKVQDLLAGLHNLISFDETREDKYGDIKFYLRDWWNSQDLWAYKLFFCDVLNLVNVIVNILLINW